MRFQRLDLNLLVALDVLLTEQSVSVAADRLCLSQSATSSALGRLREYFEDELLVLKGRQMILTPRAEELIEPVRDVLEQIRTTVAVAPPFDPATCDRQIRIMASDYPTEILLADAFVLLEKEAPQIRFEIQTMNSAPIEALERGAIDFLLTLDFAVSPDHPSRLLFEDDFVILGDKNNPEMHSEMTPEKYVELGHVTTRFGRSRVPTFDDWFMRRQKQQRRIEVVAPSFLSLPGLVLGTRRIATMHRLLAERVCQHRPLVISELPFDIPPVREALQWQNSADNDKAISWLAHWLEKLAREKFNTGAIIEQDAFHDGLGIEFQVAQGQI